MDLVFFDDLCEGQVFTAGPIVVTAEAIKTFARAFDPQSQHMDESAAERTPFKHLSASGWHTAAVTMRLSYDALIGAYAENMGLGADRLRFLRPVFVGDALSAKITIDTLRLSKSKLGFGIVSSSIETTNAAQQIVMRMETGALLRSRSSSG